MVVLLFASRTQKAGNCPLLKKKVELVGFEPTAFRMQSGRATTALKPHLDILIGALDVELYIYSIFVLVQEVFLLIHESAPPPASSRAEGAKGRQRRQ